MVPTTGPPRDITQTGGGGGAEKDTLFGFLGGGDAVSGAGDVRCGRMWPGRVDINPCSHTSSEPSGQRRALGPRRGTQVLEALPVKLKVKSPRNLSHIHALPVIVAILTSHVPLVIVSNTAWGVSRVRPLNENFRYPMWWKSSRKDICHPPGPRRRSGPRLPRKPREPAREKPTFSSAVTHHCWLAARLEGEKVSGPRPRCRGAGKSERSVGRIPFVSLRESLGGT